MSKYRDSKAVARSAKEAGQRLAAKFKPKEPTDTAPHLIVEARAGTGKTTTMVEGLNLLRGIVPKIEPSPQQRAVWDSILLSPKDSTACFVAFNKSIAEELKRRVPADVDAMTMHSMGLKAVTATYGRVAISANRVDDIVVTLLTQFGDIWDLRKKRPGLLPLVKDLVGLCKMNLLQGTPEECLQLVAHHAMNPGDDHTILAEAVNLVEGVLEKCADVEHDRQIDFDDMIWLCVKNNLTVKKYDVLAFDEFQDANRCQQALAKKAGRRLVLIGDPHQAIYGFAGADAESMKRMEVELGSCTCSLGLGVVGEHSLTCPSRRGVVVLPLTVTRRCGKAIVEEARKIVPDFEAHESCCDGKVSYASLGETV